MRKLLLLICALLTSVSGAWAIDVKIGDGGVTMPSASFGSFSGQVFTTSAGSGLAGLTLTASTGLTITQKKVDVVDYGNCFTLTTGAANTDYTFTLSAPVGYKIAGYSIRGSANSMNRIHTLTSKGGTSIEISAPLYNTPAGRKVYEVRDAAEQTTYFTIKTANLGNDLYLPGFIIYVFPSDATLVNVTYNLYESDGVTLVSSMTVPRVANSEDNVPYLLTCLQYYDYATSGTIGATDCSIKVTRTLNAVKSLSGLSNSKCYNLRNNRGWWAVANGASDINSTSELSLAQLSSDAKQQFAILHYEDDYNSNDNGYYLYSVNVNKFAYANGTKISLTSLDDISSPLPSQVTLANSTCPFYNYSAPTVIKVGGNMYGVSTSFSPDVYKYNDAKDGGNATLIKEAASFDATDAFAALESYLYPELESGVVYTFYIDKKNDPSTHYYLSTVTSASEVKFLVEENGTNTEGRKVYSFKNVSTGEYLCYKGDMSKSTSAGATRLEYQATKTKSKFLFFNLTNGKVAIRPDAASDQNYLTAWNYDNSGYNVNFFTKDANMSYWTMTKIMKTVTYNLKWGSTTIQTESSVSVPEGCNPIDYSPWDVPAYCTFTSDVANVEESTTTVNLTINWDGPFEISSDYESAVWYYIEANSQWMKNSSSWVAPNLYEDIETVKDVDGGMWAFTGNPYDGIVIMTKEKYDKKWEMYLSAAVDGNPAMNYSVGTTEKWSVKKITDKTFTLNIGDKYLSENTTYHRLDYSNDASAATFAVRSYYCQQFIDDIYTWADANHRNEYFGPTEASLTDLQNTIISMYPNMTSSQYSGFTIPDDILTNIVMKYPSTGYYRIKNNATGSYIAYGQPAAPYNEKTPGLIAISSANAANDVSSIIKLTGSGGTYKLSTQGLNVQSQTTDSQAFPATTSAGVDFVFTSANKNGIVSITNLASASDTDVNMEGSLHHATGWTVDGIVNWSASAANSKWVVEDASTIEVTLNNGGDGYYYATRYFDFPVSSNDNCLYYLSGNGSEKVTATRVDAVPAKEGFLIRCAAGDDTGSTKTITLTIPTTTPAGITTNLLSGNCAATTVDASSVYVFSKVGGDLGFYLYSGTDMPANRAYILASALGQSSRGFVLSFEDEITGISTVVNAPSTNGIFDLQGRQVNKTTKGLYIVNGKKVLF